MNIASSGLMFVLLVIGVILSGSESGATEDRLGQNGQSGNEGPTNQPGPNEQTSHSRFNFFDGELLQAVSREVQGNFVISPASVKTLLGLILEAADGTTIEEVKEMLRLPNNSVQARQLMGSLQVVLQKMNTSEVEVDSETNAFLSKDLTFNTSYVKVISDLYKAGVTSVDFKSPENAANKINSWVRTQTRGRIPSLIDPEMVDPETMTILVNTVYFDGKWKEEFQLKDTNEECFYSEPNLACNKVPIMYKKDQLDYRFDKDFNSHVVQLPYKDERFSMVLVVPATVDGTRKIARDINRLTFPALLDRTTSTEVHLKLPRFSVEYESDLKLTLTKMGLNTVFSDEAKLPFMINNKQGRVCAVIHKAKIENSEKGTKAAAASGAAAVPLMSGNEAVLVTADHPFYYFIYEMESRSVLFSGRISSLVGEARNEENLVGGGAAPLSTSEFGKPSYAHVANSGPASSSLPQLNPNRQPSSSNTPASSSNIPTSSSNTPTNTDVQYLGSNNQPYNIRPTKLPQPHLSTPSDIEYPLEHGHEYFEDYKKRHRLNNFPSQRRSRFNH